MHENTRFLLTLAACAAALYLVVASAVFQARHQCVNQYAVLSNLGDALTFSRVDGLCG